MRFNSLEYGVFFAIVVALYYLMNRRLRPYLLFAASLLFYMSWKVEYILLILGTLSICYACLSQMVRQERRRHIWFILCLLFSIAPLCYFKYTNFIIENATFVVNSVSGLHLAETQLNIILPLGISFYTFQALSYAIDVHRNRITLCSLPTFLLYILFFPQLIAGPIVRGELLIPQLKHGELDATPAEFDEGIMLILIGLFKKVVIADYLATIVDPFFQDVSSLPRAGLDCMLLLYAFSFQIYFDFGGYTDIARGSAKVLGIHLPMNFNFPYVAKNLREFWRRWHITLSTWLRDYLYIPLGGARKGQKRLYASLFVTMVLGGLWHGASWTFVLWGVYHGIGLMLTRYYQEMTAKRCTMHSHEEATSAISIFSILLTYQFVCIGWLFFRAPSIPYVRAYLGNMLQLRPGYLDSNLSPVSIVLLLSLFIGQFIIYLLRDNLHLPTLRPVKALIFAILIITITVFSQRGGSFIYFQF
ncbi:MAG: MBOAT family protein [Candidatus Abyssobacteria bacterium SURF_17]|uniref:MBOAT family protein n=1 Tax=Candidatus Abyssobacteria bacterium SURF_17 TaxID=2093361 RepID=A0A419EXW1_9BACT|nr:MAG: MBOAT family protein [Candidatus Abyssubacteria bacterium SURF_17]